MAARYCVAKSTVQDTILRFKTYGTVNRMSRIGRPRKTKARIYAHIVPATKKSEAPSAEDIAKQLPYANLFVISPEMVRKRLNEGVLEGKVMVKKPLFTK